jgi:hypothetical protein
MSSSPLHTACLHLPTPAERDRDPAYRGCTAAAGQPCVWARRYDGEHNPLFHSERIEAALPLHPQGDTPPADLRAYVLESGLV